MKLLKAAVLALIAISLILSGCSNSQESRTGGTETPSETQTAQPSETTVSGTLSQTPAPSESAPEKTQAITGEPQLSILFINVGRAESILIQTEGKSYLVDTGAEDSVPALYRGLAVCGVTKLDGLFLTHRDSDHVGGAEALVEKCKVDLLYSAKISMNEDDGTNRIDDIAKSLSLTHKKLIAGDTIKISNDAYFEVLAPIEYLPDDANDDSLVMKLHAGGITVLLTGDMQFPEENTLLSSGKDISADVLKVADHGNPDATSDELAKTVGAKIAVISTDSTVDTNTPADRVIEALGDAKVYVTQDYKCGVLLTASDGVINISYPGPPSASADIAIQDVDKDAQTITLVNNGSDVDISGYFIFSTKGSEVFVFPKGAVIKSGQTLTVSCNSGGGNYIWNEDKKILKGKGDEVILYDASGNELSRMF